MLLDIVYHTSIKSEGVYWLCQMLSLIFAFSALTHLNGRKGIRPIKTACWYCDRVLVVIPLEFCIYISSGLHRCHLSHLLYFGIQNGLPFQCQLTRLNWITSYLANVICCIFVFYHFKLVFLITFDKKVLFSFCLFFFRLQDN